MLEFKYQLWTIFMYSIMFKWTAHYIWIELKRNFHFFARLWNLKKEFENIFAYFHASHMTETSKISSCTPTTSNKISKRLTKVSSPSIMLRNVVIDTQIWAQMKMLIKFNPQHIHSFKYLWMTFLNTFISNCE